MGPSESPNARDETDHRFDKALRGYERRKKVVMILIAIWAIIFLGNIILGVVFDRSPTFPIVFFFTGIALFVLIPGSIAYLSYWRCPRCRRLFFQEGFASYFWFAKSCRHCGLRLPDWRRLP